MLFAAVVAIIVNVLPLSVDRSTWKPVSLFELSFQLRVTGPFFPIFAVRFVGLAGTVSDTFAVFE